MRKAHGGGKHDCEYYEYCEYYGWAVAYCGLYAPKIPRYMGHTLPCVLSSILSILSIPRRHRSQYRLCAMRPASQQYPCPKHKKKPGLSTGLFNLLANSCRNVILRHDVAANPLEWITCRRRRQRSDTCRRNHGSGCCTSWRRRSRRRGRRGTSCYRIRCGSGCLCQRWSRW